MRDLLTIVILVLYVIVFGCNREPCQSPNNYEECMYQTYMEDDE
jgi:hypothetical protein